MPSVHQAPPPNIQTVSRCYQHDRHLLQKKIHFQDREWVWECRVWQDFRGQIVRKKLLFLTPAISDDHWMAVAPNDRYFYWTGSLGDKDGRSWEEATLFWRAGQKYPKKIFNRMLDTGKFSPDGRFLCGYARWSYRLRVIECATLKTVWQWKVFWRSWGWFPDSRSLWVMDKEGAVYRIHLPSGTRRRLTSDERTALANQWETQNPDYCYGYLDNTPLASREGIVPPLRAYAYSRNLRVRLRVEPLDMNFTRTSFQHKPAVYIDWRDGRSRRLWKRDDHSYTFIVPADISEDGRWALLGCESFKTFPSLNIEEEIPYGEWVVVDTQTLQRFVYLTAPDKPDHMGQVPMLSIDPWERGRIWRFA